MRELFIVSISMAMCHPYIQLSQIYHIAKKKNIYASVKVLLLHAKTCTIEDKLPPTNI